MIKSRDELFELHIFCSRKHKKYHEINFPETNPIECLVVHPTKLGPSSLGPVSPSRSSPQVTEEVTEMGPCFVGSRLQSWS